MNVENIQLNSEISWKETKDHSKWAVTTNSNPGIFCIGDINRQFSQEKRGGGTLCGQNSGIWSSFNSIISSESSC